MQQNNSLREPGNSDIKNIDGSDCIFYDGYWIRFYAPVEDNLVNKKNLIESLTRRTFHHTEPGINTPGEKLELAREIYNKQTDPKRKRVNGAMLAGALFNRATDIFTLIVELAEKGVRISDGNELMRECGECFREALELGKSVRHYSGEEGIDELWGEPFKAFTMPMAKFYESRYIKIAQTMRDIDTIANCMIDTFEKIRFFAGIAAPVRELCAAAKTEAETMRSDQAIFEIWPRFVAASEDLEEFKPCMPESMNEDTRRQIADGMRLINEGKEVLSYLASARVPMPRTTREYVARCERYTQPGYVY
jgi:hypothetical protein